MEKTFATFGGMAYPNTMKAMAIDDVLQPGFQTLPIEHAALVQKALTANQGMSKAQMQIDGVAKI